jgi:hypothetical protein
VAGEGVDEVLLLEEGTWEVRCGPKGADEGGTGELTERGEKQRCGGAKKAQWRRSDRAGADTRPRREGREGDGVLGRAREGV